jgi:hypothetical protein
MDFRERGWEAVWIHLVQDRDKWHALVDLHVAHNMRIFVAKH